MELTNGAESKLELFESGERTNYKQGVHTMDAAKIAEGNFFQLSTVP
jgi:hypothetical protein